MKKAMFLFLAMLLLTGSLYTLACARPVTPVTPEKPVTQPIVLKQSTYVPAGHVYAQRAEEFASRVAEATGGRVKIEVYPGQTLCPAREELNAARMGTIDMTMTVATYLVGAVPLLNCFALPWGPPPTKEKVVKAIFEMNPILETALAYHNVKLLYTSFVPGNYCLIGGKEIRTPADLKGTKLRTAGGLTDKWAADLGAGIVSISAAETYSALQRGTVDATIITIPSAVMLRLYEVAPYITDLGMGMNAFVIAVNKDKWNQISKDDQKAIIDLLPERLLVSTEASMEDLVEARASWPGLGIKVYVPTAAEMKLWKDSAKPAWEEYSKSSPEAKKIVDILVKHGGGVR